MAERPVLDINVEYERKYGFRDPEAYVFKARKGLDRQVVEEISAIKGEPDWMRQFRLKALDIFLQKPMPTWGGDLSGIDFDDIYYYIKPTPRSEDQWEDVPDYIKKTFDRLGIPEAERKFLAGVGAQYECLAGDARVYTARGPVPIRDVQPGDVVVSWDEETNRLIPSRVKATAAKGEREVFEVRAGAHTIKATSTHPFLVLDYERAPGKQRGRYRRMWKYLYELQPGDLIAVAKRLPEIGQAHTLSQPQMKTHVIGRNQSVEYPLDISGRYNTVSLPEQTSADLMWWLGLYVGDGFIHRQNGADKARVEFAIPASDEPLRAELARVTSDLFSLPATHGQPDRMTVGSTIVARYLEVNGFAGDAHTKRVPGWVFTLPQEQMLAFLGGYIDADGYVRDSAKNHDIVLTSVNKPLLEDIKALSALCGLTTSEIHRFESRHPFNENRTIVGYRLQISGDFERVGSRSPQRTARLSKRKYHHNHSSAHGTTFRTHTNEFLGFVRVDAITPAGVEAVYDIEVEGPHNFVAEGLIVHNSEVVYHNVRKDLEAKGVIFLSTDDAVKQYPDLVKQYFGTIVPPADNKFAALNSAVWSGGSFIYVPPGVHVEMPLQAYFRINAQNMGQFERTLIIVDEGAYVHYVEGCTAPIYSSDSLHSAVVEIIVKRGARCRYTTIQNWSTNVYNLVTKRAAAYGDATMEWVDGNLGCLTGDTAVFLNNEVKPIREVEPGDTVYSVDANLRLVRHPVVAKKYSGKQQVFRLRTENFREIRATANHPFLTLSKRGTHLSLAWKRLDQLTTDDWVAIAGDIPDHGTPKRFEPIPARGTKPVTLPESSSEDLMWLLGVYMGDGYVDRNRVYFAVPPSDKAHARLVGLLGDLFHVDHEVRGSVVRINSVQLRNWLIHVGLGGNAHQKRVPGWVYTLPKAQRLAFIEGYIAADGYRRANHKNVSITSANRELLEDIKILAISCGLDPRKISRWTRREKKPLGKEEKEYTHYFLYFGEGRFQQPVHFSRVAAIQALGVEDTWDIEIANSHNFVANGFIVHNSKLTMKYPSIYLMEPGAKGEVLSIAFAGPGQHQDAGGKVIHGAPYTSSRIISKSISKGGGRTSYRGLLKVYKGAHGAKSHVVCDALLLDPQSRSDTYPYIEIDEDNVTIGHEATVSKVSDEQLFYLMSRGLSEPEAATMIVSGFIEPLVKELPMEYAIEMNRLIQLQMEGSIG
jgi:Fe-S cluster assembly scaffold protein SufB